MTTEDKERIGFACAYTPLAMIDAAGYVPFRILPTGNAPDRAGSLMHDNVCPHVKRILDRATAGDVPELAGLVLMNSCDAMRRLADAWKAARPTDRVVLLDLPTTCDDGSVAYFRDQLAQFGEQLSQWSGRKVTEDEIARSLGRYNQLIDRLKQLDQRAARGTLPGGRQMLQHVFNHAVTRPVAETLEEVNRLADEAEPSQPSDAHVPLFLFGNVLPDPEAFELFDACGGRVIADDVCTASRQLTPIELDGSDDVPLQLARGLLSRPACARTLEAPHPGVLAQQVLASARDCGAKGVIAHVMKFCDPYLARMPAVREVLRDADLPLLVLEGDCTLRSLGQQRTRIEAFVEMLGGSTP
jgi:benzoyl-CoA reductase/2-hydroxyglutaryl-CoA dehydratase subunit BcrC/BadD/HgdB